MDTTTLLIVALAVLLLVVIVAVALRSRRSTKLRDHFGPEYERAVHDTGGRRAAEAELKDRAKRVAAFAIVPLRPGDRERYVGAWRSVQSQFVDDPKRAVTSADSLLADVMAARGYPVGDFEQRAADLSVDHPVVVQNYRAAHGIALRHARGEASTEDLRQAMIHYRELFDDLVNDAVAAPRAKAS
jgi:hypothetical protein